MILHQMHNKRCLGKDKCILWAAPFLLFDILKNPLFIRVIWKVQGTEIHIEFHDSWYVVILILFHKIKIQQHIKVLFSFDFGWKSTSTYYLLFCTGLRAGLAQLKIVLTHELYDLCLNVTRSEDSAIFDQNITQLLTHMQPICSVAIWSILDCDSRTRQYI